MDSRVTDLQRIARIRDARHGAVEKARLGKIADVLVSPLPDETLVYVVKLLDVDPRLGKVAGRRVLADAGVSQFARVADLTSTQRDTIIHQCEVVA